MEELGKENKVKENGFYKWIVVALCFLMVTFCFGFCSSTYSWFINYIVPNLGVYESLYSIGKSIRFITMSVSSLFFGFMVIKFGTKKLILAGMVSLILSMLCHAFAKSLVLIYVGGLLLGLGLSWAGTAIVGYIVNQWFKENKGTIMGIILASNGLGSTIATYTIKPVIELSATSYKQAYLLIGLTILIVALLFLFLYREKKDSDVPVPKKGAKKKPKRGQSWSGIEYKEVIKKPYFYLSLICIFLTGMVLQGITGVATPHLQNVGLGSSFVSLTIVIHSISLIAFKFFTGFMYDKLGLRLTSGICMIAGVLVMIALALVTNSTLGMIFALTYSIFSSLALPLETIMLPIYTNDLFGEKAYNRTIGIVISVNTAGYALGAPLASLCRDIMGNYNFSFWAGAGIMATIFILIQFAINSAQNERKLVLAMEEKEKLEIEKEVVVDEKSA